MTNEDLGDIEEGRREPWVDELESLSQVLALPLETLLNDSISGRGPEPLRMLMKSSEVFGPSEDTRARIAEAARAALDLIELCEPPPPSRAFRKEFGPQPIPTNEAVPLHEHGSRLAQRVRQHFDLSGPIASLRDFVTERLNIPIIGAELGEDGPDAFTVYAPNHRASVIVLNLHPQTKNMHPLTRRFSLAHEVGHALFDRPANGGAFGVACKVLTARKLATETRANAFAMRLLFPEREFRKLSSEILDPKTFGETMATWGVHYAALRLYTEKMLDLSPERAKTDIPTDVETGNTPQWQEAESLPCEREPELSLPVPMHRREPLMRVAFEAWREERIGTGELRHLLGVDSRVLPGDVGAALGFLSTED